MSNFLPDYIFHHLPVLQVIIPLLFSGFCVLLTNGRASFIIAQIATSLCFLVTIFLLYFALRGYIASYPLGNWPPPIGIEYKIDILNAFILFIVSFMGFIILPYAAKTICAEIDKSKHHIFYALYLLCLCGLIGITTTNDIFNIYVFLEISSLSSYALIAMSRNRRALYAGYNYLILGTIGATFFLIGIGILYMATGSLNISDIAARIKDIHDIQPLLMALFFITGGLLMKAAMWPVHYWLVDAYSSAPSAISSFLSATATKVAIYVMLRVIYTIFGAHFISVHTPFLPILCALAVIGVLSGSLNAMIQKDVRRILAFSSIAQIGYIALGISAMSETALAASLVHIANHALAKSALFLAVGAVYMRVGGVMIDDFKGIARHMPYTMAAFLLAGLSLIGVPFTAGFISKWYFIKAFIESNSWPLVMVVIAGSLMAIIYIWRVIDAAYFGVRKKKTELKEAPMMMLIPIWILVFLNIYLGVFTEITLNTSLVAAKYLIGAE